MRPILSETETCAIDGRKGEKKMIDYSFQRYFLLLLDVERYVFEGKEKKKKDIFD